MHAIHTVSIARYIQPRAVAHLICETAKDHAGLPWTGVIYDRFADGRLLRVTCRRGKPVKFSVTSGSMASPSPGGHDFN